MRLNLTRVDRERDVDGIEEADGFIGLVHPEKRHADFLHVESHDPLDEETEV